MPAIYFSKSANGFFMDGVNANMPEDRVEISEGAWQHLLTNQSQSVTIGADSKGYPVLIDTANGNEIVYSSVGQA